MGWGWAIFDIRKHRFATFLDIYCHIILEWCWTTIRGTPVSLLSALETKERLRRGSLRPRGGRRTQRPPPWIRACVWHVVYGFPSRIITGTTSNAAKVTNFIKKTIFSEKASLSEKNVSRITKCQVYWVLCFVCYEPSYRFWRTVSLADFVRPCGCGHVELPFLKFASSGPCIFRSEGRDRGPGLLQQAWLSASSGLVNPAIQKVLVKFSIYFFRWGARADRDEAIRYILLFHFNGMFPYLHSSVGCLISLQSTLFAA